MNKIENADLIILGTPVFVGSCTGSLKLFLDHLAYMWLVHRPKESMFNKVGLIVTSAGGSGVKQTTKLLKTNLFYWGVPQIFNYGVTTMKMGGNYSEYKNKDKIIKVIALISMIMFFIPTFAVSCGSEVVDVSACNAMIGKVEDTTVNEPTYAVILLLIIPVIMLIAQALSNGADTEQKVAGVMAIADIIGWLFLKSGIEKYCEENMCSAKTNTWFVINIILLAIAAILSFMKDFELKNVELNNVGNGKDRTLHTGGDTVPQDE